MKRLAILVCIAAAYLVAMPLNRTEAEDAYAFAWAAERDTGRDLLHPHHLAYLPVMKAILGGVRSMIGGVGAHAVLTVTGAFSAAAAVMLFATLLAGPFGLGAVRGWAAAAGLAVSYGFWRYAAEAEVYALMLALALASWSLAARARGPASHALSGALGGAAALMHIFGLIPALGAIPIWLAVQRRWTAALLHGLACVMIVAGVYGAAGISPLRPAGDGDALRREGGATAAAAARAAVGLGQSLVSGNFIFAQAGLADRIQSAYPARMLEEEVFMGRAARPWMRVVPWGTLAVLAGVAVAILLRTARVGRGRQPAPAMKFQPVDDEDAGASKAWIRAAAAAAIWFAAHAVLLWIEEPGNPELWIAALPPVWILLAVLLAALRLPHGYAVAVALAMAVHNWAGGMALLHDPGSDYNVTKASAVLAEAQEGDLVITAGGPVFHRYLRYSAPCPVLDAWAEPLPFPGSSGASAGTVFILGDVFIPPPSLTARFRARAETLADYAEQIRPRSRRIREDDFGGVFVLDP